MEANNDNTISLKEYFERILVEKDKAISAALASAKEAVSIAENNAEKWRNQANEWRGAMSDREKNFVTRREVWLAVIALVGFILSILQFLK